VSERRFWLAVYGGVGVWVGVGIMLFVHTNAGGVLAGLSALLAGCAALAEVWPS